MNAGTNPNALVRVRVLVLVLDREVFISLLCVLLPSPLYTNLYNVSCIGDECFTYLSPTTTPSPYGATIFLHSMFVYPDIIMYRKITGQAADNRSAATTDTNPTFDVP